MKSSLSIQLNSLLSEGASLLSVKLDERQQESFLTYLECLIKWNFIYNLSAIREPRQILIQHVLDSLAIVPVLASYPISSVLDVGSGGGLPGVVLAISKPDWQVTVNDAVQKKTAFLTHLKAVLPLPNLHVLTSRVETVRSDCLFSALISRAFASLSEFVSLSRHLAAPGASIWAMKGIRPEAEISEFEKEAPDGAHIMRVIELNVPFLNAARHLVQIGFDVSGAGLHRGVMEDVARLHGPIPLRGSRGQRSDRPTSQRAQMPNPASQPKYEKRESDG